jgi:thiamine biosynthesis lipoprotein
VVRWIGPGVEAYTDRASDGEHMTDFGDNQHAAAGGVEPHDGDASAGQRPDAGDASAEGSGRIPEGELHRFAHDAMGCTFEVRFVCPDRQYARRAAQAVFAELDGLELELSHFVEHSDVSRIGTLRAGQQMRVSADTYDCLTAAFEISSSTVGVFDVTYRTKRPPDRPASLPVLELDSDEPVVKALVDYVQVDLGGIGKGYALDRMADFLSDWSIDVCLLHAGQSTVLAHDGSPRDTAHPNPLTWRVALRDDHDQKRSAGWAVLTNQALSGSGRLLHGDHIVDARTGRPTTHTPCAWAIAPTATVADALSTAFMIMSRAEMDAFLRRHTEITGVQGSYETGRLVLRTVGPHRVEPAQDAPAPRESTASGDPGEKPASADSAERDPADHRPDEA